MIITTAICIEVVDENNETQTVQVEHSEACPKCGGKLREKQTGGMYAVDGEVYDNIHDWDVCEDCGYEEDYDLIQMNRIRYLPTKPVTDSEPIPF